MKTIILAVILIILICCGGCSTSQYTDTIGLRIVVEDMGEAGPCISYDKVAYHIIKANQILSKTGLCFKTVQFVYLKTNSPNRFCIIEKDVEEHENKYLNVYYTYFPLSDEAGTEYASGLGYFPWYDKQYIRLLAYGSAPSTLAHEIGHVFGLRHTFDDLEDIIDTDPVKDARYSNIMNYCLHDTPDLTINQAARIRYWYQEKQYRWQIKN